MAGDPFHTINEIVHVPTSVACTARGEGLRPSLLPPGRSSAGNHDPLAQGVTSDPADTAAPPPPPGGRGRAHRLLTAALITAAVAVVACGPPAPQYASSCDPNHTPGNDRSWCMVWIRGSDGAKINPGPVWEYQHDQAHGGATVVVSAANWRSAP